MRIVSCSLSYNSLCCLLFSHDSGFKTIKTVLSSDGQQATVKDRETKPGSVQVCGGTARSQGEIYNK